MRLVVTVDDRRVVLYFEKLQERLRETLFEATKEAGQSISRHIKDDLLTGEVLFDTSGFPRADSTTSLPQGALRKSIFSTPSQSGGEARVSIGVRGDQEIKDVAAWLTEGRTGPWLIEATNAKALHMIFRSGDLNTGKRSKPDLNSFDTGFAASVMHPGYGSHDFMHRGLEDGKIYFVQLAQRAIRQAIKNG